MTKRTLRAIVMGTICINMVALIYLTLEVNNMKSVPTVSIGNTPVQPVVVVDSIVGKELIDIKELEAEVGYYQAIVDSIEADVQSNFDYAHPRFKRFNNNIDSTTTMTFAGVMNAFDLDATTKYREMYTGQILLESGAKQHRPNGNLVVSSAGCIGFCQIMPATCLGYFQKYMDTTDIKVIRTLGSSEFTFAFDSNLNRSQQLAKTREWLSDVTNNIIMWGFITRHNLNKRGDIYTQLVSYNMGSGGANKFIANGGNVHEHKYIRGIHTKLSVANN